MGADKNPLESPRLRKRAERDNSQFIPYKDFNNNPNKLKDETLRKLPGQVTAYMNSKRIIPYTGVSGYPIGGGGNFFDADKANLPKEFFVETIFAVATKMINSIWHHIGDG